MNREHGDDMRRLLRRADPAASLAPVGDDRITRLAEDAMNTDTTTPKIPAAQPAPSPRPGPLRWVFVGAGALAAGAAAAFVLPALLAPPTVTTLQLSDADPLTQMCAQITPEIVASGDLAFRADVESIEGGVVTLRVTERFQGEVGDFVRVEQGDDEPIDGAPIVFRAGETYLVSTSAETIGSCGESGIATPELEAIYAEAFPG